MKSNSTCANGTRPPFGSSPRGCAPAIALAVLDAAAVSDQTVEPAGVDVGAELARLPDDRFAGAEHQPAVFRHARGEPLERQRLLLGTEIQEDVPAEDDVEI